MFKYSTHIVRILFHEKKTESDKIQRNLAGIHQAAIYAFFIFRWINSNFIYSKFTTVNLHTKNTYLQEMFLCVAIGTVKWILHSMLSHLL